MANQTKCRKNFIFSQTEIVLRACQTDDNYSQDVGNHFDQKLFFNEHINDLMNIAYMHLSLLRLLKGTTWGARAYAIIRAYEGLIRHIYEYGALITGTLRIIIPNSAFDMMFKLQFRRST